MGKRKQEVRKKLSVKRSFYGYIFVMFVIVVLLSAISVRVCINMRDKIISSHAYILEADSDIATSGTYVIPGNVIIGWNALPEEPQKNNLQKFTDREKFLCHVLEILVVVLPLLFVCTGIWIAGSVFYSQKLKKPFALLEDGIEHIQQGDLDFSLDYPKQDELGQLCGAFETMRREILKNNTELWKMVDERKKLNASVAHDLRTPITVIKGYSEYVKRNLRKDTISQENMEEILSYIENAALRLEAYADSVHSIYMLENLELEYNNVDLSAFSIEITSAMKVIAKEYGKQINVSNQLPDQRVLLSTVAIFRILENIVQNACYYSRKDVFLELGLEQEYFTITVIDDGDGFSEKSIHKAFHPFYKETGKENHYGMGLAICKILSRKHGGNIFLSNTSDKGAKIFVQLKIRNFDEM